MEISGNGRTEPVITRDCVSCGACLRTCPQQELIAEKEDYFGKYICCQLVRSKDDTLLQNSTSGGFVTTLIRALLEQQVYSCAFLTDAYAYDKVVQTRQIRSAQDLTATQKSRYVQIGHGDEIRYILGHREEKVILVGTPCYFRGFLKVVEGYHLNRENYLLIGLFCDKTMTMHIWEYFDHVFAGEQLGQLEFRVKQKNGWPGDVRLLLKDGTEQWLPRRERMAVKDYFMPESCLYCPDKLNADADFSVGDDYVSEKKDGRGRNTVIVRTERAEVLWNRFAELFDVETCGKEQIAESQHLKKRRQNADYAAQKQSGKPGGEYRRKLRKINMGEKREYRQIHREVLKSRKMGFRVTRKMISGCKRLLRLEK